MSKNKSYRKIKYKQKGCSDKKRNSKRNTTKKNKKTIKYLGGKSSSLAYTPVDNPQFQNDNLNPNSNLAYTPNPNPNPYPNQGPAASGFNFLNSNSQNGGSGGCGCGKLGGGKKTKMKGGDCGGDVAGTTATMTYPNGLVGNSWSFKPSTWPSNHLGYNTYYDDVPRQMVDVGSNYPFSFIRGGKRGKNKSKKSKLFKQSKSMKHKHKGGALSNFLGQDLIDLGQQFKYNLNSSYNALRGYSAPVNPTPWKDQLSDKNVQILTKF